MSWLVPSYVVPLYHSFSILPLASAIVLIGVSLVVKFSSHYYLKAFLATLFVSSFDDFYAHDFLPHLLHSLLLLRDHYQLPHQFSSINCLFIGPIDPLACLSSLHPNLFITHFVFQFNLVLY